jgi:hypothetical protein
MQRRRRRKHVRAFDRLQPTAGARAHQAWIICAWLALRQRTNNIEQTTTPWQGLVYPLDTVRTRLAVCHTDEYAGIWQTAVRLARNEGFAAFYRGLVPSMVRPRHIGRRPPCGAWVAEELRRVARESS